MLKLPPTKFLKQGDSLRLECKVSGTAPLKVTWYKHDSKVTDGPNCRTSFVDSVAVLELLSTSFDDDGVYTCEAQNDAGLVSCSTTLSVKGQPVETSSFLLHYSVNCCESFSGGFGVLLKAAVCNILLNGDALSVPVVCNT